MHHIDCCNLSCPEPVIIVKRAIDGNPAATLSIVLDHGAPRENVSRFLTNRGYTLTETNQGSTVLLQAIPPVTRPDSGSLPDTENRVMLITSTQIGDESIELGQLLMKNFIISLLDQPQLPQRMIFLNSAIHLTTEGSEVLTALNALANRGVEILSCGLCLDYFQRKELLRAGSVTNMFVTAESLLQADVVIKL